MDTLDTWLTCTRVSTPDLSENSPQILVSCPQTNIKLHSQSIAIGKISLVLKYLRILSEKKKILVLAINPPKLHTYFYIFQFSFPDWFSYIHIEVYSYTWIALWDTLYRRMLSNGTPCSSNALGVNDTTTYVSEISDDQELKFKSFLLLTNPIESPISEISPFMDKIVLGAKLNKSYFLILVFTIRQISHQSIYTQQCLQKESL